MVPYLFFINIYSITTHKFFSNENLHKSYKQKLALSSKNVDCKIVDDENNYYIFKTVMILLFNNEINITNKTILSFNFTLFIFYFEHKKSKRETTSWLRV